MKNNGKNILLVMTNFYGYNQDIIEEMEKQGHKVTWYQDQVKLNIFERALTKINDKYKNIKFMHYFDSLLQKEKGKKYDIVLIVFGAGFMTNEHIKKMRNTFPSAKIVYYAWDSVKNFPIIASLFDESDIAYSFDKRDCEKYGVNFLPLFYVNKDGSQIKKYKWDVSTVMSFYNKKSQNLMIMLNALPSNIKKYFFIRLRNKSYYIYTRIVNYDTFRKLKKYFTFKSLNREECLSVIRDSKAVLDCPLPNQNGLTMRTFETLALNRKLITTNKNIKEYDFYCDDNIFVVDKDNRNIPIEFFRTPFNEKYSVSEQYGLANFVSTLIDN